MKKIIITLFISIFVCGCSSVTLHEDVPKEPELVCIYDVVSQDRNEIYVEKEMLDKLEDMIFTQHLVRMGIFTSVGDQNSLTMPYKNQINSISIASEIDVEYVVMGSWEELENEIENPENDGITKIVIFDNSYTGSLLKEAASGKYADLEKGLEENGIYDQDQYEQTVLSAGYVDGGQIFVPLLYNVSGMIHGERFDLDEYGNVIEPDEIEGMGLSYEGFIEELKRVMLLTDVDSKKMSHFSAGFLEEEIDLYLTASGISWNNYEMQYEVFSTLYDYLELFMETQELEKTQGTSLQEKYAWYLNMSEFKRDIDFGLGQDMVADLGITSDIEGVLPQELPYTEFGRWVLDNSYYFVETTSTDEIPYHSILGLLEYRNYYCNANDSIKPDYTGEMGYWPIGVWGSDDEYAAHPICYAAVLEDGNVEAAVKVIKGMLDQEIAAQYGFSLNNEIRNNQIDDWESTFSAFGGIRSAKFDAQSGEYRENWNEIKPYWNSIICGNSGWLEDKGEYATQLRSQLDNVVVSEIPDQEILSIWQETLIEMVNSGISKEQGFEILCERMDLWYKE